MERLVAWLTELSPLTIYLTVGLSTLVENVFPPAPSDLITALGGFLTQHTGVNAVAVWAIAWGTNMAGAVGVYHAARRHGRRFLGSPLGRRLLPAEAILSMEREYLRFGLFGIFLARLLPGFRTFLAPFVGLVNLPPLRALLPMALSAALWYAGLVYAGARLGQEWDRIHEFIGHLNRTMGALAVVVGLLLGWWLWRRSREAGPRRRRLLRVIRRAMGAPAPTADDAALPGGDLAAQGAAALLFELTHVDPGFSIEEREAIAHHLRARWGTEETGRHTTASHAAIADTAELATIVAGTYQRADRVGLAVRLYRIAMADGTLSLHEERLMRRAADLLGLTPEDLAEARRQATS